MTPQQSLFKVLVLHNKLLGEEDLDALLAQTPEPVDIVSKLVAAEMMTQHVAEKFLSLYQHNLKKKGLPPAPIPAADETGGQPSTHAPPHHHAADHPDSHGHGEHRGDRAHHVNTDQPMTAAQPATRRVASSAPTSASAAADGSTDLLVSLLEEARRLRASDLHLMSGAAPVVRIASALHDLEMPAVSAETVEHALQSILHPEQWAEFLRHKDLDCSLDGNALSPGIGRFRMNVLRQHRGVDAVFRLIPDRVPTFDELKLPEQLRKFTLYRQGVVLVTGPKGSGKTTTLAALIDLINTNRADHIITIEDPIEFVHPCKKGHVNQREVGPHTQSFANALRASLREAPDVIMIGEMRDLETISLAITAAETGHLVFGTLHTPDAQRTINRVIDVFPPKEQGQIRAMFSESLRGVVSQHLLPDVGGKSMHLACEILFNTGAIANIIRENRAFQIHGIMQTHRKQGMCLMDDSLLRLVREKKVSREEALARAENVGQMEKEAV